MLTKTQLVSQFYHSIPVRVTLISLIVGLTFLQYDHLFFILFAINIPHFFLSSYRKSQRPDMVRKLYYSSEIASILAAVALALISTKLLLYITFFRFTLHFFEDEHFNSGQNLALSVLLFTIFTLEDFPAFNPGFKIGLALLGLSYFIFSLRKITAEKLLNFYPVYFLLIFLPILQNKTFNSSSWGYNLGILHSVMWLSWDGFGKRFELADVLKSSSFIITAVFMAIIAIYVGYNNWDFQPLMKNCLVIFYIGLFSHVASVDFYRFFLKLSR